MNNLNLKSILNVLSAIFMVIVFSTCASKEQEDFVDLDSSKIDNEIQKKEKKFEKFKVVHREHEPEISTDTSKLNKTSRKSKHKNDSSVTKENSSLKKAELPQKKTIEFDDRKYSYPSDYPKANIKYDKESASVWKAFSPKIYVGEMFTFRVSYLGLTAGHIQLTTKPVASLGGEDVFHFKAQMRSARYYSYIYKLDDSIETFVSTDSFIPRKYILLQRESAQTVDDLQLFDEDELKTYHFYNRLKEGKRKKVELEKFVPRFFQDSYSALHFVRGLPMNEGDHYQFPIVTRGKIWILEIKVEGVDEIKFDGKWIKARRINAETRFPGVLEKKGDILFWYSDDDTKRLLKFEAQVKIGSVEGVLTDYKAGDELENL